MVGDCFLARARQEAIGKGSRRKLELLTGVGLRLSSGGLLGCRAEKIW